MGSRNTRELIGYYLARYPRRTALLVFLLALSGLSEAIGIATLLPLLEIATESDPAKTSGVSRAVTSALASVGLAPRLEYLLLLMICGMWLKGGFRLLAMKQVGFTVAQVAADLRLGLIETLLRARWRYFVTQPIGRLINAVGNEANRAASSYEGLCALIASAMQATLYAGVAFWVSWQIALVAIFGGMLTWLVLGRLVRAVRQAGHSQAIAIRALVSRLTDALQGIKPIKAMGRERHLRPLLEHETHDMTVSQRRQVLASHALTSVQEPVLVLLLAVALYGALTWGTFAFATILLMTFLFNRLAGRLAMLQSDYQVVVSGEGAFWSLRETIESAVAQAEPTQGELEPPETLREGIRFEGVSFAYDQKLILDRASFTIPGGSFVALMGPSGAGKTTVADLIAGLYEPTEGRILVDGIPLPRIDLALWRRQLGYVPQEMLLFHDTIAHNVRLGDPDISDAAIEEALRVAGAWGFVEAQEHGVHTVIGERGTKLSGGQRQRIAIARAMVHQPSLLLLDEVTTALDPETEAGICETLRRLSGQVTILAVSHQPAMMEVADLVLTLENGRILPVADPVGRADSLP